MRKVLPTFALLLFLTVLTLLYTLSRGKTPRPCLPIVTETLQNESVGTINRIVSQVQTGPPDNLQFLDGLQDFHNGDGVRVTDGGKGELKLNDNTRLTLFNQAQVSGVSISISPKETHIQLDNEGFDGYVPPGCRTIVDMPNGTQFIVLGTNFFTKYDTATQVATGGNYDGTVHFIAPGGTEQELPPGQMVDIPAEGEVVFKDLPFTPEQFEAAVDRFGTPTAGLTALEVEYQIAPLVSEPSTPLLGIEVVRMTHESYVSFVTFSPDGRYVASGGCDQTVDSSGYPSCIVGSARVWEAATGKEISRMTYERYVGSVVFSPDGKYIVSGGCDNNACTQGSARVWEAATGTEISRMTHVSSLGFLSSVVVDFSPDGRYVVSGSDNTARVWEAATGTEISRMTHDGGVKSVAFSPDGRYVASESSGRDDYTTRVWEAATGKEISRMTYFSSENSPFSVAFSPDGKYIVSGGCEGKDCYPENSVRVWEAATGMEISRMIHEWKYLSVAFSPDGKYVISGSWDHTARVWEAATGMEISRMTYNWSVHSVDFGPDGRYVASGGCDQTVYRGQFPECILGSARVWEAATGKEISRMTHEGIVNSVAFSPDGRYVVSGGGNTIIIWPW